jgi:putative acetyltransferase
MHRSCTYRKIIVVYYNYLLHDSAMNSSVESVRDAARQLVRELHLLDGRVECCGVPLSECHLITELNQMGEATASELCERLVLEKSTMSRLVNKVVDKGLVCASCCQDDRRSRILCLTEEGKAQARMIDRHARDQVASALDFLAPKEKETAISGLALYARSLRRARIAGDFTIRPARTEDDQAIARIIGDAMQEFGLAETAKSDAELASIADAYSRPGSAFFVIEKDGEILGGAGFGPLGRGHEGVCELRKMYFAPGIRGAGMGSRLLGMILETAREAGYEQCYLETMGGMDAARKLYQKHGFEELESRPGGCAQSACNRFMIRDLN